MTQQNTLQGEAAQGLIVKALGGFYYVQTGQQLLECRARGLFRKEDISPMVGDQVMVEESQPGKGTVTAILPRKNSLIRPPVANLDRLAHGGILHPAGAQCAGYRQADCHCRPPWD